jgi:hypothetical protein
MIKVERMNTMENIKLDIFDEEPKFKLWKEELNKELMSFWKKMLD